MRLMVYHARILWIMVYRVLLWTDVFSNIIHKMVRYKFYNNNLSVVLRSKQEGTLKLVNHKHEDWASIQLVTLSVLTFLFTLPRCQVIFQWEQTKEKLGNALNAWREFYHRLYLVNGKYLLIFLGFFARMSRLHILLLRLSIFAKGPTGKFI